MIHIENKQDCCGCGACAQRCPRSCITMKADEQGFRYPEVDLAACIQCGLCEKVCPVIHQTAPGRPLATYAVKSPDEAVRLESSSGGVFTLLAEQTIDEGGVVFGAQFDENWNVVHDCAVEKEELAPMRGAKYVQSNTLSTFKIAESLLKHGRKVLYVGTPCQISGLKNYLRKEYDRLILVDIVCHGVPSPAVWQAYLKEIITPAAPSDLQSISFRNKDYGWSKYSLKIMTKDHQVKFQERAISNTYLKGYVKDFFLRPSCFSCPAKNHTSGSDITLADFWGIKGEINDDKGVGLVFLNTEKGKALFDQLKVTREERPYEEAIKYNPSIVRSVPEPKVYRYFWDEFAQHGVVAIDKAIAKSKPNLVMRVVGKIKAIIRK